MITPKQASDFVTRLCEIARDAKKLQDDIVSVTAVGTALNVATDLTVEHLAGDHAGLDLGEVKAALPVLTAVNTGLNAGNPSNMTKLIKIT